MIRTKIGIKSMDKWARKYSKILHKLCYVMIAFGFLGMIVVSFELIRGLFKIMTSTASQAVGLVLPVQVKGAFYVPFGYWLFSVLFVLVVHEFSHGLIARLFKLKVKSTGIAFLGVLVPLLPGAFVEPDEKKLAKASAFKQLSVYAAGPFANLFFGTIFTLLFFLVLSPMSAALYDHNGVEITGYIDMNAPAAINGMAVGEVIKEIDGTEIRKTQDFSDAFESKAAGDRMHITTDKAIYDLSLAENNGNAFLGVYASQTKEFSQAIISSYGTFLPSLLNVFVQLIYWLALLNLGVGLFNLVPLGPLDGGRMLHTALCQYWHKTHATRAWKAVSYVFLFVVVGSILFSFFA